MALVVFRAVYSRGLAALVLAAGLAATLGFAAGRAVPPPAPEMILVAVPDRAREAAAPAVHKYVPGSIAERRVVAERRIVGRELQLVRETEAVVRTASKIRMDRALLEADGRGIERLRRLEQEQGGRAYVVDPNLGSTGAAQMVRTT